MTNRCRFQSGATHWLRLTPVWQSKFGLSLRLTAHGGRQTERTMAPGLRRPKLGQEKGKQPLAMILSLITAG